MADTYIWRTQLDDRVRPRHAEREGKEFRWDSPPLGGHPGEDYNCRCWAATPIESTTLMDMATIGLMTVDEIMRDMKSVRASLVLPIKEEKEKR